MSILTDAQKSALFGRLLGLPSQPNPVAAAVPERVAPTGTVAGTAPATLANAVASNKVVQYALIGGAVLAVVLVARKLFK